MKARLFNYLITLIIVGLALWAAVSLYIRYIEHPWTRDGQVRATKTSHSRVWFEALDGVSLCRMDRAAPAPLYCPQSVRQSIGFAFHSAFQSASRFWRTARCHCGLVKPFLWQ
jgi:hypothetical protein